MDFSCGNCNINHNIEKIKDRLECIVSKENQSLLDNKVINLSQLLDNFIYKCTFCNKNLNYLSKLNSKNILNSKLKSNFQYLGNNHFLISLYFYMFQGIKNNQMIYLSMDENLYNDLLTIFKINSLPIECIKFRSIKEVIVSNKNGGLDELEEKIIDISSEYDLKNYSGFRWISQPTYAIENTSLEDFFNWEMNLSEALENTNSNSTLGFVYKEYNPMKDDNYVNEPVIDKSLNVNSYVLDELLFKGVEFNL